MTITCEHEHLHRRILPIRHDWSEETPLTVAQLGVTAAQDGRPGNAFGRTCSKRYGPADRGVAPCRRVSECSTRPKELAQDVCSQAMQKICDRTPSPRSGWRMAAADLHRMAINRIHSRARLSVSCDPEIFEATPRRLTTLPAKPRRKIGAGRCRPARADPGLGDMDQQTLRAYFTCKDKR